MMATRIRFSEAKIDRLAAREKPYRVFDEDLPSFCCTVYPNGRKTLGVYRSYGGKPFSRKIATFGHGESIDDCRKIAAQINGELLAGKNPNADLQAKRESVSLDELWQWFAVHAEHAGRRTLKTDKYRFFKYFPESLRKQRIAVIGTSDLAAAFAPLKKAGKLVMYNRLAQLAKTLFTYAAKHHNFRGDNPAKRLERFTDAEQKHERYLTSEEFTRFRDAVLAETDENSRDLFQILLMVGCRVSNALAMKWADLSLDRKLWTINASESKNRKRLVIPLSDVVVQILERRKASVSGPFVFPSDKAAKGHMNMPDRQFERICTRAGIVNEGKERKDRLRIHSLRHSFAVRAIKQTKNIFAVSKLMGHANFKTTLQRYADVEIDEQAAAINAINAEMANGTPSA